MAEHGGALGAVYAAKSAEEVAAAYDGWAEGYDAEMAATGYRHPSIGLALLARHLPRGAGPVLDAGCGTGIAGPWFGILGWPEVWGADISEGMLAVAARKGAYARLMRAVLGQPLDFPDGAFAAVISTGVFTTGHVGAEALPELVRITAKGGVIVLTVKGSLWDGGFAAALRAQPVELLEVTEPYVSMPADAATTPSRAVVARVR
ncbi:methyltransferase domain-containing protein [Rhodobacter sp. SGA-6-6]|uniref:class I SAM-dependent DNA methyltransferase n=1 Tax=Rhodobacter sp. SGA-6-6 TaxID=2710882 RepID=UPI0013EE3215|nr:class I SAM-dependent methyltransferase [Rhodobacter sp. SGA-6-6]NGM47297.1 methyltransferase domain-containing protein [Rhodobacter sp. SGA-6-6]